ncbi:MAG: cupin domain-containing protein [Bacteroidales bacterium]|nr:cupin domain-containing protein [Bacteroidales bacterium]
MVNAEQLIQKLGLESHPEGGFYRETYRSELVMPDGKNEKRNVSTAIYFMLTESDISRFHRIKSDEIWFFHQGQPIELVAIIEGQFISFLLGNNIENGEIPQVVIPANTWFAARIPSATGFSLVSCTVAPGFDFHDFELADSQKLLASYPMLQSELLPFLIEN